MPSHPPLPNHSAGWATRSRWDILSPVRSFSTWAAGRASTPFWRPEEWEPDGKVIGVDMTPEMIAKARHNASLLGVTNVEFILGEIEDLPLPDASVDLVISNGVFNLCPDKPKVLSEVFRVLKPGGRLQMADILLEPHVTPEEVATKGSWSD